MIDERGNNCIGNLNNREKLNKPILAIVCHPWQMLSNREELKRTWY